MRAVLLLALVCVVAVTGVAVGRPVALHNKLAHRRAQLGESQASGELERLRVAASERDGGSLADQFASDLEAHVIAKDALKAAAKADAEATAGLDVAVEAETEAAAETEAVASVDLDVAQAVAQEAEAEEAGAADQGSAKDKDAKKNAKKSAARNAKDTKNAKAKKADGKRKAKAKGKGKSKGQKKVAAPKASVKAVAPKTTTLADGTKWSNCLAAGAKGVVQTQLSAVTFKAAPPLREQSYVVEIDGTYTGPDVTYGSVTMQIARVKTHPQEVEFNNPAPEVVYRHSVVLKDVLMYNPFTSKNPLSATMYVPEAAFSRYAPAGDYALTVEFTNQDKQLFACTKVEFSLA